MTIAILAHDSRKELALQFCTAYSGILSRNTVIATGTTGRMLAQATGLTPEDIAEVDLATAPVASLQAEMGEDGLSFEGVLGSDSPEESIVEKLALRTAIDALPERERQLILLRYFKGLTQDKTAKVLGISQVQVSRLEKKILLRLRGELSGG